LEVDTSKSSAALAQHKATLEAPQVQEQLTASTKDSTAVANQAASSITNLGKTHQETQVHTRNLQSTVRDLTTSLLGTGTTAIAIGTILAVS